MIFGPAIVDSTRNKVKSTADIKNGENRFKEFIIDSHFVENEPYFLFLVDHTSNHWNLEKLQDFIRSAGFKSYIIAHTVTMVPEKSSGLLKHYLDNESQYESLLTYKGVKPEAIMTFGASLYSINKSTDVFVQHFYSNGFTKSYFYLGHGFCRDVDSFVFPVDSIEDIFPTPVAGEFINYKTRIFADQIKKMKGPKQKPDMRPYHIHLINSREEADDLLRNHFNEVICAWDTETSGFNYMKDRIGCFTISWDGVNGYYVPFEYMDLKLFVEMCKSCKHTVGANIRYDILMGRGNGMDVSYYPTDDINLLSHVYHSSRPKGLKPGSYFFTYFGGYDLELDAYKKKVKINNYLDIPTPVLSKYATLDAIVTWRVFVALCKEVDRCDKEMPNETKDLSCGVNSSIASFYKNIVIPTMNTFIDIEWNGIYVDWKQMAQIREYVMEEQDRLRGELAKAWNVPKTFNFFSAKDVTEQIAKMKWPKINSSASGGYSTDAISQKYWRIMKMPGIEELTELRHLNTTLNNYLGYEMEDGSKKGWENYTSPHEDGTYRIHHSYKYFGTETFRFIGNNPNMQQVPANHLVKHNVITPPMDRYTFELDDGTKFYGCEDTRFILSDGTIKKAKDITENDEIRSYLNPEDKTLEETPVNPPSYLKDKNYEGWVVRKANENTMTIAQYFLSQKGSIDDLEPDEIDALDLVADKSFADLMDAAEEMGIIEDC